MLIRYYAGQCVKNFFMNACERASGMDFAAALRQFKNPELLLETAMNGRPESVQGACDTSTPLKEKQFVSHGSRQGKPAFR